MRGSLNAYVFGFIAAAVVLERGVDMQYDPHLDAFDIHTNQNLAVLVLRWCCAGVASTLVSKGQCVWFEAGYLGDACVLDVQRYNYDVRENVYILPCGCPSTVQKGSGI